MKRKESFSSIPGFWLGGISTKRGFQTGRGCVCRVPVTSETNVVCSQWSGINSPFGSRGEGGGPQGSSRQPHERKTAHAGRLLFLPLDGVCLQRSADVRQPPKAAEGPDSRAVRFKCWPGDGTLGAGDSPCLPAPHSSAVGGRGAAGAAQGSVGTPASTGRVPGIQQVLRKCVYYT